MPNFTNQIVFITGAGSGIGRATALAFAKEGAHVAIADINEENGHEVVAQIREIGGEALFIHCDVASPEQIDAAVQQTVDAYGRLDIGINNAGIGGKYGRFIEQTKQDFDQMMAINVGGVFYGMQAQLRQMMAQQKEQDGADGYLPDNSSAERRPGGDNPAGGHPAGGHPAGGHPAGGHPAGGHPAGGKIVNVSSIAGVRGMPMGAPYSASKHAVIGLTKTAALEYVRQNIRINAVCPVYTHSTMVDELISSAPGIEDRMRRMIPLGRFGQPEEIAQAILWLCSAENAFCTGQALQLDGGMTAG